MAEKPSEDCLIPAADRRLVVPFILLLSFFSLNAGINWNWEMPEKPLLSKTRIACRLMLDLENPELLTISLGDLPSGITLTSGPNIRPVRQRDKERKWHTKTRVSWYFYLVAPGIYSMPSVSLEIAGVKQEIPIEDFIVLYPDETNVDFPSMAAWRVPQKSFYVGQNFPVTLKLLNQTSILFPSSFYARFSSALLSRELDEFGDIERSGYKDRTLYSLPGKSWMITPVKAGTEKLESGRFYLNKLKRYAPAVSVSIKPLPAQVETSGAVGSFSRKITVERSDKHLNEVLCILSLSGEGNFDYLTFPSLTPVGLTLISTDKTKSLIPSDKGYKGSVSALYRFSVKSGESCSISSPSFVYFEPSEGNLDGSIRIIEEETIILDAEQYLHPDDFTLDHEPLNVDIILSSPKDRGLDWLNLLYFCLPSFSLVIAGVFISGKKGLFRKMSPVLGLFFIAAVSPVYTNLAQAVGFQKQGVYDKALPLYDKIYEESPYSGILYNKALISADSREWLDSLYYLRQADRLSFKPADELIGALETEFGFIPSSWSFSLSLPTGVFFVIIILVYMSALFFLVFRKTTRHIFLLVSLIFFCLFSGFVTWAYTISDNRSQQLALLLHDTALHKLPDAHTEPWIHLPAGSDIQIQARQKGYLLIDNGNNVQGWILDENYREY